MGKDVSGTSPWGVKALIFLGVVIPIAVTVALTCAGVVTW